MHEVEAESRKANINLMKMAESDWIRTMRQLCEDDTLCPSSVAFLRSNAFKFLTIHSFLDFVVFHIFRCGLIYVHASIHRNIDEKFSQVFYTSYNNSWESFLPNTFSMLDDCQPMGSIDFILESQTCCHFPDNSPLSDNINRCNELVHDFVND